MIIADANIIAYLVVPGPYSRGASEVLDADGQWLAPSIWQDEVLNALAKHVRNNDIRLDEAVQGFAATTAIVRTVQRDSDSKQLIEMAVTLQVCDL